MLNTWERVIVIIISVIAIMAVVQHYEKRAAKQSRYITELTKKNAGVSKWLYKSRKGFTECKVEKSKLRSNCFDFYKKCKKMVNQCDYIITNKKNCSYPQDYLERL